jgi:hypothetical protein
MLRYWAFLALSTLVGGTFFACGDSGVETLCNPGDEVFCKCRGGFDGTKTCLEDGNSFGDCVTPDGPCPEIETSTSSGDAMLCEPGEEKTCECADGMTEGTQTCEEDGESFGACMLNGSECAMAGTKGIYEACETGAECLSGTCEGFCTKPCGNYMECAEGMLFGDCVNYGDRQLCAQYCLAQEDCAGYGYAADVICGGFIALDDPSFSAGACGRWGADAQGLAFGTVCDNDLGEVFIGGQWYVAQCDLGLTGKQNACIFGECSPGCIDDQDCPVMEVGECFQFCCFSEPGCQ